MWPPVYFGSINQRVSEWVPVPHHTPPRTGHFWDNQLHWQQQPTQNNRDTTEINPETNRPEYKKHAKMTSQKAKHKPTPSSECGYGCALVRHAIWHGTVALLFHLITTAQMPTTGQKWGTVQWNKARLANATSDAVLSRHVPHHIDDQMHDSWVCRVPGDIQQKAHGLWRSAGIWGGGGLSGVCLGKIFWWVNLESSESVQCAITGQCLRMGHRPSA